jgi:transposase
MTLCRKFSPEFKSVAVRLASQPEIAGSTIANDIGIHESVLRRWMKESTDQGFSRQAKTDTSDLAREVVRLRKENAKLKMERDIIKKALGYFVKDPQ